MKAVILAAGEGRRLKPLTNLRPKPMIPIANQPLLEHVIQIVERAGINDIVLVVGYKRDRIQTYFGDGDDWGVNIEYAVQEKQLGTGHAILQAEEYVENDFLVLNGDRIIEEGLVESLASKDVGEDGVVMSVTRSDEPSEYGVVEMEGERVIDITEKPPVYETKTDIINAGVYRFGTQIFDDIRGTDTGDEGELAITSTLRRMLQEKERRVHAVRSKGMWIDVSYLWDLLSVNSNALDRLGSETGYGTRVKQGAYVSDKAKLGQDCRIGENATVAHGTSIGDNVSIGANAAVSNSVIFPDSNIAEGAVVKDCVVAGNTYIGPNVTVEGGDADVVVEGEFHEGVRLGGVVGDNSSIGGGAVLEKGTIVGNDVVVGTGATVSGRISPSTEVRRG